MTPTSLLRASVSEVRFYRGGIGIAYDTGSRLRKLGVIKRDVVCDDDRPIFLLSPESIEAARSACLKPSAAGPPNDSLVKPLLIVLTASLSFANWASVIPIARAKLESTEPVI